MREIKFRAWVVNSAVKEMMYPSDTQINSAIAKALQYQIGYEDAFPEKNNIEEWQKNIKFMQFTGLKDKNGVEIYEVDIVNHDGYISVVSWGKKAHGFKLKTDTSIREKWGKIKYYSLPNSKNIEVIGNIYQNPELL